jgi:acyl-coenzyme A thioesterase PaaI-like protein
MISPGQLMNASFEPFHLVNTYGAFGSVGRERHEIVFEGKVTRIGDGVAFGEAEARRRSDGELLAKARLTFAIPTAGEEPA